MKYHILMHVRLWTTSVVCHRVWINGLGQYYRFLISQLYYVTLFRIKYICSRLFTVVNIMCNTLEYLSNVFWFDWCLFFLHQQIYYTIYVYYIAVVPISLTRSVDETKPIHSDIRNKHLMRIFDRIIFCNHIFNYNDMSYRCPSRKKSQLNKRCFQF